VKNPLTRHHRYLNMAQERQLRAKRIITRLAALSHRERQVATLVCDGLSNKMIARKLGISEGTVKIHLHNIYTNVGISSRNVLAAALALSRGGRSSARRSEDR
jgi:two-component system nitrate/nitrite response regulator NarL